ncbi:hypothetical protein [Natronococcus occultus]|uniref:Uncharacterized protein n=1 Tax=Natronococcus occultus SP4 TaxID=694430 RepID=L0JYD2_9EURY|nr:hypothetical protein [Natronococcus occultus]AGB37129.1 hypothetical protein Natoc_1309 [Natronococcus occultus SP4]
MQPSRTAVRNAVLVGGAFLLATGIITGLVPTPLFERMVPRTALDYTFLALTALLAGAYVLQRSSLEDCDGDRCAYGGAASGFFAVACPHCNAVLVALFGSSWLATYVDPIRPLFGVLAIGLLGGVLYARRNSSG